MILSKAQTLWGLKIYLAQLRCKENEATAPLWVCKTWYSADISLWIIENILSSLTTGVLPSELDDCRHSGHTITSDSDHFTVSSILLIVVRG